MSTGEKPLSPAQIEDARARVARLNAADAEDAMRTTNETTARIGRKKRAEAASRRAELVIRSTGSTDEPGYAAFLAAGFTLHDWRTTSPERREAYQRIAHAVLDWYVGHVDPVDQLAADFEALAGACEVGAASVSDQQWARLVIAVERISDTLPAL